MKRDRDERCGGEGAPPSTGTRAGMDAGAKVGGAQRRGRSHSLLSEQSGKSPIGPMRPLVESASEDATADACEGRWGLRWPSDED